MTNKSSKQSKESKARQEERQAKRINEYWERRGRKA